MGLTTLTEREKHWIKVARLARQEDETWEPCPECLQYHPAGYEGSCEDKNYRLPGKPDEFVD